VSTTLPTGVVLPELGGDSSVWDDKLNGSLTTIDALARKLVALNNDQFPIGTKLMIPENATVPAGWEAMANWNGRTMVSTQNGIGGYIVEGEVGGSGPWNATDLQTGGSGSHTHGSGGAHSHTIRTAWTSTDQPLAAVMAESTTKTIHVKVATEPGEDTVSLQVEADQEDEVSAMALHRHQVYGHTHSNNGHHTHSSSGTWHSHSYIQGKFGCGGIWIEKIRDLTLADLLSQTPVD
jgi:hypothetical protein